MAKHRGQDYYEFSKVIYNNDKKPGYLIADLTGTESQVNKKAKELWSYYIPYPLISSTPKEDKYPVNPSPAYVATFFDWIYAPDIKRWFLPEEHIPYPKSKCEKSRTFKINSKLKASDNKIDDLKEQYEEWLDEDKTIMFSTVVDLEFLTDSSTCNIATFFSLEILSRLQQFVGLTIQDGFAVLNPDEDDLFKILAWKKNEDTIRIQIHDYSGEKKVNVVFDAEIPLVNFIVAFEMFFNKITVKHCELLEEVKKSYQKQKK